MEIFNKATVLRNRTCAYYGCEPPKALRSKEHVIGRKFVPKGSLGNNAWNLILMACEKCNGEKADLEDEISAVSMMVDVRSEAIERSAGKKTSRDVFDADGFSGSFSSDAHSFLSFQDTALGQATRPAADARLLHSTFTSAASVDELRRLEKRRGAIKEDICRELCRRLGVEAAVTSYDDLEGGILDRLDGWRSEQLLYVFLFRASRGADKKRETAIRQVAESFRLL
jgi:hypothetical protein